MIIIVFFFCQLIGFVALKEGWYFGEKFFYRVSFSILYWFIILALFNKFFVWAALKGIDLKIPFIGDPRIVTTGVSILLVLVAILALMQTVENKD